MGANEERDCSCFSEESRQLLRRFVIVVLEQECLERLHRLGTNVRTKIMDDIEAYRLRTLLEEAHDNWVPGMPLDAFCLGFSALEGYLNELFSHILDVVDIQSDFDGDFPGGAESYIYYWAKNPSEAVNKAMTMVREDATTLAHLAR